MILPPATGTFFSRGQTIRIEIAQDSSVKEYPADAAHFRRNETILFFRIGNADAQLDAAEKAIALDPGRAILYYFKGQALAGKATIDPKTRKMVLSPGCVRRPIRNTSSSSLTDNSQPMPEVF